MTETRSGGCLCGAVRYQVAWPPAAQVVCHCKDCQRQAGTAFSIIVGVPRDSMTITGALKTFNGTGDSGGTVYRHFCGECGSPILSEIPGGAFEGQAFIKAGTLDDTSDLAPAVHVWTDSAQPWLVIPEGVINVAKG